MMKKYTFRLSRIGECLLVDGWNNRVVLSVVDKKNCGITKDQKMEILESIACASVENEKFRDALLRIDNWAKAYSFSLSVLPELDFKKVAKVLKAAGLSLDEVSASNMRHVLAQVKDITKQVLKE